MSYCHTVHILTRLKPGSYYAGSVKYLSCQLSVATVGIKTFKRTVINYYSIIPNTASTNLATTP